MTATIDMPVVPCRPPIPAGMDRLPGEPESVRVEIRCPRPVVKRGVCHPGKLFAVMYGSGETPTWIQPDNLIEMSCLDCKRAAQADGRRVRRVLHRYDFAGQLVGTLYEEE